MRTFAQFMHDNNIHGLKLNWVNKNMIQPIIENGNAIAIKIAEGFNVGLGNILSYDEVTELSEILIKIADYHKQDTDSEEDDDD